MLHEQIKEALCLARKSLQLRLRQTKRKLGIIVKSVRLCLNEKVNKVNAKEHKPRETQRSLESVRQEMVQMLDTRGLLSQEEALVQAILRNSLERVIDLMEAKSEAKQEKLLVEESPQEKG